MTKEVSCTRGFGRITDPQTGERYNVERDNSVEVSDEVAERLKAEYSGIEVVDVESNPKGSDDDEYVCGVNDCSRTVDSPEATCWQH